MTRLSLGGCFVDGLGRPTLGEPVRIGLRFADGSTVVLLGEVVYVDRVHGFGVRFGDLTPDDAQRLTRGLLRHGLEDPERRAL